MIPLRRPVTRYHGISNRSEGSQSIEIPLMMAINRLQDEELVIMGLFSGLNPQSFEIYSGKNGTILHPGFPEILSMDDGL